MRRKSKWGTLVQAERDKALLSELRRGRTLQNLIERLDAPGAFIEEHLERLRRGGVCALY